MAKTRIFKLPLLGRLGVVSDRHGSADFGGSAAFNTNLSVKVFDKNGREREVREYFGGNLLQRLWYKILYRRATNLNLGSGLVTNVGVLALSNEFTLPGPSGAPISTLKLANWHASGTGTTSAAATDIKLQTISTQGGQTPVAGTQTLVSAANLQKYQTVATISYTGTEAVTEWGLLCGSTVSAATGSPFTAGAATTGTSTGTALTASSTTVQGHTQNIVENTGNATPHWGLIVSNSTSVFTVPAWYKVSDGTAAGVTPANTNTYVIRPVMWDHKVFSAINVVSGDSIQFTYVLTNVSGG